MSKGPNYAAAMQQTASFQNLIESEAELIVRVLNGQRECYYDLVAPYQRMVYVSALSVLRDEAEAEDCAQESLIKALCHLKDFKGKSKFGSWLVRIALNEAKMRRRKLRPALYESLDGPADHNGHARGLRGLGQQITNSS